MGVPLANIQVGLILSWDLPVYGPRHQSPHLQNKVKFLPKRLLENSRHYVPSFTRAT